MYIYICMYIYIYVYIIYYIYTQILNILKPKGFSTRKTTDLELKVSC